MIWFLCFYFSPGCFLYLCRRLCFTQICPILTSVPKSVSPFRFLRQIRQRTDRPALSPPSKSLIRHILNVCCLCLIQEASNAEAKPRPAFHHAERGRYSSSSPNSNGEPDQLSKTGLNGESAYRRRYKRKKEKALNSPTLRCRIHIHQLFLLLRHCAEETIQFRAVRPSRQQSQRTGARLSSRSAHRRPSASWTCTGTSALLFCLRAPGPPGSKFASKIIDYILKKLIKKLPYCFIVLP